MIGTSINIERNRLERVQKAAFILGISECRLLSILLMKSRRLFGDKAVTGHTVDYQRKSGGSDFIIHHINISETDYELATSRRYVFKISVSFLFAMAIDEFLSEIIYEWTTKQFEAESSWRRYCTNLYYNHFHIDHFIKGSAELWLIPWPREKLPAG